MREWRSHAVFVSVTEPCIRGARQLAQQQGAEGEAEKESDTHRGIDWKDLPEAQGMRVGLVVCFTVLGGTARAHRTPAQKRAGFPGTNIEKGSRVAI